MNTPVTTVEIQEDPALVAAVLAGRGEAFGHIVERYQSLVCALTYSATGNVSRSEDLAQETFVTAWRELASLRDPARLRAWLCGIARHVISADRRRQGREPADRAEPLEAAEGATSTEPMPAAQAVTAEEAALLWREVGRLPENYREIFVLYYREQKSAAQVAAALELGEDAVMQRLSRGRKMLQERLLVFVEGALDRTRPGREFRLRVDSSLALLVTAHQAGTLAVATGLAPAKGAAFKGGVSGGLVALAMPFLGMLAAVGLTCEALRQAPNGAERRFIRNWHIALWSSIGVLLLALRSIPAVAETRDWTLPTTLSVSVGVWFVYLVVLVTLLVVHHRRTQAGFASAPRGMAMLPPTGNPTRTMLAGYFATTAWIIGLAWLMGDGLTAIGIAVLTALLAAWNLRRLGRLNAAAGEQLNMCCHAALCLVLLLVANLRVGHWLAPLYGLSVAEMRHALPMALIHGLSLALVAWVGVLLLATQSRRRLPGQA